MNKYILLLIATLVNIDSYLIYNNETINTFTNISFPNICGELINYNDNLYLTNSLNINKSITNNTLLTIGIDYESYNDILISILDYDIIINYLNEKNVKNVKNVKNGTNGTNGTIIACYYTNNDSLSFFSISNFILPTIIISIVFILLFALTNIIINYCKKKKRNLLINVDNIDSISNIDNIDNIDNISNISNLKYVQTNCSICLNDYLINKWDSDTNEISILNKYENITILPCQHIFHKKCIQEWFLHKQECPICRGDTHSSNHHA
jgi:hypothetical protein